MYYNSKTAPSTRSLRWRFKASDDDKTLYFGPVDRSEVFVLPYSDVPRMMHKALTDSLPYFRTASSDAYELESRSWIFSNICNLLHQRAFEMALHPGPVMVRLGNRSMYLIYITAAERFSCCYYASNDAGLPQLCDQRTYSARALYDLLWFEHTPERREAMTNTELDDFSMTHSAFVTYMIYLHNIAPYALNKVLAMVC